MGVRLRRWSEKGVKVREHKLLIDGGSSASLGDERLSVVNPSTGQVVASTPVATPEDVAKAVEASVEAQKGWGLASAQERSGVLYRVATLIEERFDELVSLEVEETGRPIEEIKAVDVAETADCFRYFASVARLAGGETVPLPDPYFDYTVNEPVGVVAALVPWNFPLNLASWKVAPALAAGNGVILKPAEQTPSTALMLGQICIDAGLPAGVFNVITGDGPSTGDALISHPAIDLVAFTGGPETGNRIAAKATALGKRVATELGGKSAQLVFDDAPLDAAIPLLLEGGLFAVGQNCCAGSRVLASSALKDEIIRRMVAAATELVVGPAGESDTQIGPVVSQARFQAVQGFLERARREGAHVEGGEPVKGYDGLPFMSPAIVSEVGGDAEIVQEEVFGPVIVVEDFDDEDAAIRLANSTQYDLAAGIWTSDVSRAHRVASRLRAGTVWVNTYNRVFNDAPFGGMRFSGHGRDLGRAAYFQYTRKKNVCISLRPGEDAWF
jgi:aldehyde dehydrogenase (NAD+)